MKITFEIDTTYDRTCEVNKNDYRAAAAFLLHLVGDLKDDEETPAAPGTHAGQIPGKYTVGDVSIDTRPIPPTVVVPPPPVNLTPPPPPPVPVSDDDGEDAPSNVLNFPTPPPPPAPSGVSSASGSTASTTLASTPNVPPPPLVAPVMTAAAAGAEGSSMSQLVPPSHGVSTVDSAHMPYDARIHQKSGNKKKDGTWKLIKGIDPAIVQAVTIELAARKGAVAPVSLPASIPLPPGDNRNLAYTVPLPPVAGVPAPPVVPAPPISSSVPVPPVSAVGPVGGITFRDLIDKLTAATKAAQITPAKVNEICQNAGAPSLMQLDKMPNLIPEVNMRIDAFLAGLG